MSSSMEPENCALVAKFDERGYIKQSNFEHDVAKVPMREVGIMIFISKGLFIQNITIT